MNEEYIGALFVDPTFQKKGIGSKLLNSLQTDRCKLQLKVFALSFANVLWQKLIAANGVNRISPFVMTEVFFSALAGYLLFGNVITLRMSMGMLFILIGISLASRKVPFAVFLQCVGCRK